MNEPSSRRRHPRVSVHLPISFGIVVPEDTFAPQVCDALVCDISAGGVMVAVRLSESVYRNLLHATRYVRITFNEEPQLPRRLIGRAVYIQPISQGELREYRIGVCFDEMSAEGRAQMQAYVDGLLAARQPDRPAGGS